MTTTQQPDSLQTLSYLGENVGGFTVAGPHHRTGSQDCFWPAASDATFPLPLSHLEIAHNGRLYLLADGVSLCADGQAASSLAIQTTAQYYYQTTNAYPETEAGRMQRLEEAIWQAHLALLQWDERYFCWRSERHTDGVPHYFKKEQLSSHNPPLCPLCAGNLVGLQTTLMAVLVRGQRVIVAGIGDSIMFRLPARAEFGIETVYSPQDEQFLGMPSLSRPAIMAQAFLLNGGDHVVLCSDGVLKVLNALHDNNNWHHFLRERFNTNDLRNQVRNLMLDLNVWRATRPRQGKLQDDLTIVAVAVPADSVRTDFLEEAQTEYDQLQMRQRVEGVLPSGAYEGFLSSAAKALLHDDAPNLWQLYANALHSYALAKLNECTTFDDEHTHIALRQATQLTSRTKSWLTAYFHLGRLQMWAKGKGAPAEVSSDVHTQIVTDLYSLDLQDDLPQAVQRIIELLTQTADTLSKIGRTDDAGQYRSFSSYLRNTQPRGSGSVILPYRDETPSTILENSQVLELRIAQAIAEQDWALAQELIIELNKLKGGTLNLDTESVDTTYARRRGNWRASPRPQAQNEGSLIIPPRGTPTFNTPTTNYNDNSNGSLVLPPHHRPSLSHEDEPTIIQMGVLQQDAPVYYSRNPEELLRDCARSAFHSQSETIPLDRAYELAREAAKQHPDLAILSADWQQLWVDPLYNFHLEEHTSFTQPHWRLADIATALQVARDSANIVQQAKQLHSTDLREANAKAELRQTVQWQNQLPDLILPYDLGQGMVWRAHTLCHVRSQFPPYVSNSRYEDRPYFQARKRYNETLWQAILAQGPDNTLLEQPRWSVTSGIDEIISLQESPWVDAAIQLQNALQQNHLLVAAFSLYQLLTPEYVSAEEQTRLTLLQEHYVNAAWEHIFTMAERRKPLNRDELQATQTQLLNSQFEVSRLRGALGLRLSILYNLLSLLIHDEDGAVINGFYGYELKVPRQLNEGDFRRLNQVRQSYIGRAWETTLNQLQQRQPYYLPPSSRFISRIKPDGTTAEGRRLQAVRALLPLLGQSYEDWIEQTLTYSDWQPPLPLSVADQQQLEAAKTTCAAQAWDYVLQAIRGQERPELTTARLHQLRKRLTEWQPRDGDFPSLATRRLLAIRKLLMPLLKLKTPNIGLVHRAVAAQSAVLELQNELNHDDLAGLQAACALPLERLWQWSVQITRNPFTSQAGGIRKELEAFATVRQKLGTEPPLWQAIHFLLTMAAQRLDDPRKLSWEATVRELFKAYHILVVSDTAPFEEKQEQLHQLAYGYLVDWKDSLPVEPALWRVHQVNAEKQRIIDYWLLRDQYRQRELES